MSELIKEQFNAVAQSYDQQRRQLIPCFDEFYGLATNWVDLGRKAPRILDLGAGTGLFSSYIRLKYPEARLTLFDLSDEMLAEARNRFREDDHIHFITGDLVDLASYDSNGPFDAVISSLSIHHLSHPDKRTLFHTIYNLLSNDGIFVNADQVSGGSSYFDSCYKEKWEDSVRRSGLSGQVVESAIERRKLDMNASVEDQLTWLKLAGFTEVDCIYKYHEFAVFYSRKDTIL